MHPSPALCRSQVPDQSILKIPSYGQPGERRRLFQEKHSRPKRADRGRERRRRGTAPRRSRRVRSFATASSNTHGSPNGTTSRLRGRDRGGRRRCPRTAPPPAQSTSRKPSAAKAATNDPLGDSKRRGKRRSRRGHGPGHDDSRRRPSSRRHGSRRSRRRDRRSRVDDTGGHKRSTHSRAHGSPTTATSTPPRPPSPHRATRTRARSPLIPQIAVRPSSSPPPPTSANPHTTRRLSPTSPRQRTPHRRGQSQNQSAAPLPLSVPPPSAPPTVLSRELGDMTRTIIEGVVEDSPPARGSGGAGLSGQLAGARQRRVASASAFPVYKAAAAAAAAAAQGRQQENNKGVVPTTAAPELKPKRKRVAIVDVLGAHVVALRHAGQAAGGGHAAPGSQGQAVIGSEFQQ
ncbi:hypothetical protein DL768_000047 [Monosporascus sp. mg162]|nr:hypothetical protein DL768_000047 [Monosporascus sp. mg162]